MTKENKSRFAILGILDWKPCTGYEIKKIMEGNTSHFWNETDSSIYPMLSKLQCENKVTCTSQDVGKREKKIYTMTSKGKKEFTQWMERSTEDDKIRNELLLKVYFGHAASTSLILSHLEEFRQKQEEIHSLYRSIRKGINEMHAESPHKRYLLMTIRYGELHTQANLDWANESIQMIKNQT